MTLKTWRTCGAALFALFVVLGPSGGEVAKAERRSLAAPPPYVFRIKAQSTRGDVTITGHGTAFGVNLAEFGNSRPRHVLTACHVIRDTQGANFKSLTIEVRRGGTVRWLRCRPLAWDVKLDIAILECESDLPVCAFARHDALCGSQLEMIGGPGGTPLRVFGGTVSETPRAGKATARVEYIKEGCSGGPLVDARTQRIIGLVSAGIAMGRSHEMDPHTCLYVPRSTLLAFIERSLHVRAKNVAVVHPAPPQARNRSRAASYVRNDRSGMWLP